jgi:hypothetical protein
MRRSFFLSLCAALACSSVGLSACSDDEHKGTISHGPTASAGAQGKVPRTRLVYQPGTPLATTRVAKLFKKRLSSLNLLEGISAIKIGGDTVHVDVPTAKVDAIKKALSGGRFDLFLFDETADPFAAKKDEHAEKYTVKSERVKTKQGDASVLFLVGPDQKGLHDYAAPLAAGHITLIGPVRLDTGGTGHRTYFAQSGRSVRGEFVKSAKAEGNELVLTFQGMGTNFLRWSSRDVSRYLVQVDGRVVAAVQPETPVNDGVLRVTVPGDAAAIAKSLDGVAISHDTVFEKTADLPPG